MGRRKRRSLSFYRRVGLYEQLARAQAAAQAAYGSAYARAKFQAAAQSLPCAYGCVPCACPTDASFSPLTQLLNPQKYSILRA